METSNESISKRFARVYGSPGEAPRVLGLLRAFWPLLLICLIVGYLLRAALPVPALEPTHVGIVGLVIFLKVQKGRSGLPVSSRF